DSCMVQPKPVSVWHARDEGTEARFSPSPLTPYPIYPKSIVFPVFFGGFKPFWDKFQGNDPETELEDGLLGLAGLSDRVAAVESMSDAATIEEIHAVAEVAQW